MKIHFTGIGGVGMAGLAVLLKGRGHDVSGCDVCASTRTRWLEAQGVRVSLGHDPRHVEDVDEVVLTPAVRPDEPERVAAAAKRVRFRGEVLAGIVGSCDSIAVCGTHGKTTTSTWIAKLLIALGEDVTWCIGGETGAFPVAGRRAAPGSPPVLVVEADESDGTLALYRARTLVVNKLEYDHPDHFKTPDAYFACFDAARRQAKETIESEDLAPAGPAFSPVLDALPPHNRKNARAAVEVALRRGHSAAAVAAALPSVVGALPDRRFQRVWPEASAAGAPPILVYADYAHHPTEMACAVSMARRLCRGTLRVLFQPHRPSRTKALLDAFPDALAEADELVLCPTYMAFEPPVEGGDVADLYRACRASSARCLLARSCEEAWEHAHNAMRVGDFTLLLGAGDIIRLVPRVRSDLSPEAARCAAPVRRIWIGAGTNTWRSDLDLPVEYVKTQGPAGRLGAELVRDFPDLCPWMAGIPGTVGGWIKMNAGAFGHSFSEVLDAVCVDGAWRSASECGFAYRHSDIQGEIQDFRLKNPSSPVSHAQSPADYLARRKGFPPGTFGSFFKNPPGDFAGRLLEESGAKALSVGGAYVWPEHANVIVRGKGATGSDVLALARLMRNRVYFRAGVLLESEVSDGVRPLLSIDD